MKNKLIHFFCILIFFFFNQLLRSQISYFDGQFRKINYIYLDRKYNLYDFKRENDVIKTKYFAKNAYEKFLKWKNGKQVLLITAGAFSDSFEAGAKPIGLCIEGGKVINREIKNEWDGLVLIYNSTVISKGLIVLDLSVDDIVVRAIDGSNELYNYKIKKSSTDRVSFVNWSEKAYITLFQTQLIYSQKKPLNFINLDYGEARERRFLAICNKDAIEHHIIVDVPNEIKLNLGAKYAKTVLEHDGYTVSYILNLDTGDKNLLYVYNGFGLENLSPNKSKNASIENATNLLVFYKEE